MQSVTFFAVRNHHAKYFQCLAEQLRKENINAKVVRHKSLWLLPILDFSPQAKKVVSQAVDMKINELRQQKTNYRLDIFTRILWTMIYTLAGSFLMANYYRYLRRAKPKSIVSWSGIMWHQLLFSSCAQSLGIKTIYMENGPLPNTTAVDNKGVNYLNSMPRDSDFFKGLAERQSDLPTQLVERHAHHKKNLSGNQSTEKTLPEKYIFVPFQVDTDKQILAYSPWISNMNELFDILSETCDYLPDNWVFVVKEHPSCKKNFDHLHELHGKVIFLNNANTQTLISNAQAVLTINSSVGIESLLLEKPVLTLGKAFYNVPELVIMLRSADELKTVIQSKNFPFDKSLARKYLLYLYYSYLVQGSWKQAEQAHIFSMCKRIKEFTDE